MQRVLVIDDEPGIRFVIAETLKDAGYEPIEEESAAAAMARLVEGDVVDLIVMDLTMRGLNGKDFLSRLRENPDWSMIPAILVTGAVYSESAFPPPGSYSALLQKPFTLATLLETVARAMEERRIVGF